MQIGISNTLSRFHSRSNLRAVNESSSLVSSVSQYTMGSSSSTASRGFKHMLSTSLFLSPRLGRRESIRTQLNASHI
ncbi:unnamed protein product [Toxocara canis]|nr:unnamed protein product [Toxocara canis]